jgi:predicted AAA+ superfamily ATPase
MNLREIILDQQKELEDIERQEMLVERENLLLAKGYVKNPNLLVVMGIRRCGKSIFSYQISKGEKSGYFNFDDERLIGMGHSDLNSVLKTLYSVHGDMEIIVLDEIQNVEGWEIFANRLRRTKRVVITGSNSKMLEGDLSTKLTGRYLDITIFPFSFREYLISRGLVIEDDFSTKGQGEVLGMLVGYMEQGGFPEVKKIGRAIIPLIFNNILSKDIISKYNIRKRESFTRLAKYLITNHSTEITYRSLGRIIGIDRIETVSRWIEYLREAFLVLTIERFHFKLKEQFRAPKKVYCVDTGIINTVAFKSGPDQGRLMENIVAVQLQRYKTSDRDIEVYYWKDHAQREVDFVVKREASVITLIQVTYAEIREDIRDRELVSLCIASEQLRCDNLIVITWTYEGREEMDGKRIVYQPIWKWLLDLK